MRTIRVGVSACLIGVPVRYDGDHRRDAFVAERLGRHVKWVVVCPESEAGFGVPRETLQLVGNPDAPRLVGTATGRDRTPEMQAWTRGRLASLASLDLCGFVLKRGSPSCGPAGVRLSDDSGGEPVGVTMGLFARALAESFPEMPLADEGMLDDRSYAAGFLCRVRARHRARLREEGRT